MGEISKGVSKGDGLGLILGRNAYLEDKIPCNTLFVKVLRCSSSRNIKYININDAVKIPGVECILTNKSIHKVGTSELGEDEFNSIFPNDIALIAALDEESANEAMKLIKIEYELDEIKILSINKKDDLSVIYSFGNVDKEFKHDLVILEEVYRTQSIYQGFLETCRSYTYFDQYERLVVVSTSEVPFLVRKILSERLQVPIGKIRVIKPKTGGGYGGKSIVSSEYYPAIITLKTGKPAKVIYTVDETFNMVEEKSETDVKVKLGATREGKISAIDIEISQGPVNRVDYSDHPIIDAASEVMSLYNFKAARFLSNISANRLKKSDLSEVVFGIESTINNLGKKLNMDIIKIHEINMIKKGNEINQRILDDKNYALDYCIKRGKKLIEWDEKYPKKQVASNKVRGIGMSIARQDIGVPYEDAASSTIKFNEDGTFMLTIGTNDLGICSSTILSQICAEAIGVTTDKVMVLSCDTDLMPFYSNTYSTKTLYALANAVKKTGEKMRKLIIETAGEILGTDVSLIIYDGETIRIKNSDKVMTMREFGKKVVYALKQLFVCDSYTFKKTTPSYMAGFVEVEVDTETGKIRVENFVGVFDIGTVINPTLMKVEAESSILRGIGMAMYEEVKKNSENNMDLNPLIYRIPTRNDFGNITVEFTNTYDASGVYGAKSSLNIGFNTVPAAIQEAVYNAIGVRVNELPITSEKIIMNNKTSK
ncbi:xanthine dehydrogenase family protein molybdopterin-binding subunit [Clostridium cylindrosporum]|uniref:Putative hypoxanthine oxidase XdhD n=1 Tax=Clostridium cylindrosporum DSM 605 TaxID=1121307 RepID=A0A0J8D9D6_CLOCY|nr:molybdopterin cofactor-binding domain-containing protein [Clostridium cylindrosporum]KMT20903.1 putative hypoxanthine oxidase XdhD [Clostridium cylindrosporum DSM 605]